MYSAEERINVNYYKLTVEDYLKNGYNEDTAQIEALKELQKKFSIYFKEVTEDDCVWNDVLIIPKKYKKMSVSELNKEKQKLWEKIKSSKSPQREKGKTAINFYF